MSQGLCCRCLEAIYTAKHIPQREILTAILSPSIPPGGFQTSTRWGRGFFLMAKNSFGAPKTSLLSKQNPMTYPWDWYIFFTYMKTMKINDSCRYTVYHTMDCCMGLSPKKIQKNEKSTTGTAPKKSVCVDPFLSYLGIGKASILTKQRYLGPRQGVIFKNPGKLQKKIGINTHPTKTMPGSLRIGTVNPYGWIGLMSLSPIWK